MFEQILVSGFVKAGVYAVLVAGLSLMFGVARILNLSYTGFYMIGAFLFLIFHKLCHFGLLPAACASIACTAFLGMISYVLVIDRVKAHEITVMIISLAISLLFQEVLMLIFGGNYQGMPPFKRGFLEIGGVRIAYQNALTIGVSRAVITIMGVVLARTRLGVAIRSVAQDREIANLMGINVNRICLLVTTAAMALAGLAGVMMAPIVPLDPHMWVSPLMVILAAIVLGGLGSLKGSIIAAFILGYVETGVVFLVPLGSFLKEAVLLAVMAGILLIRPEGLFGLFFEEERL
jgi:branched-chain amino acid transport system permease protein